MKYKILAMAFVLTLTLISCASVGVSTLKQYPAKSENCRLDIYTSRDDISKSFEVISVIDSRTGSTLFHSRTAAQAIENARPYACQAGADAILIKNAGTTGVGYSSWGEGNAIIEAIKYKKTIVSSK